MKVALRESGMRYEAKRVSMRKEKQEAEETLRRKRII